MGWRGATGFSAISMALILATTGCSSDDSGGDFPTSGVFASTPESTFPLVDGTSVNIQLTEGRLSASAGCNTLMGTYTVADNVLSVPMLASTRIGCPDDLADQDQRLEQLLTSSPRVSVNPLGFTIAGSDGTSLDMTQVSASPTSS